MAIVANKGTVGNVMDVPYTTPNRTVALEPNGVTTPGYTGEIVLDLTANCLWKATSLLNTSWVAITAPN